MGRYQGGARAEVIDDFLAIHGQAPRLSAAGTCLSGCKLLDDQTRAGPAAPLRTAVKLNPQDPRPRIISGLAIAHTGAKGVREHIDLVLPGVTAMAPELSADLQAFRSPMDLRRSRGWTLAGEVGTGLQAEPVEGGRPNAGRAFCLPVSMAMERISAAA